MKNVAVISGSPNGERSETRRLVADFLALVGNRVELEVDHLSLATGVSPCAGCYACMASGVCRMKDELSGLHRRLAAADLVILASPMYAGAVSAQMKAFIDRSFVWAHAMKLFGKPALTAVTSAFAEPAPVTAYLTDIACAFGAIPVGALERLPYRPAEVAFVDDPAIRPLVDEVVAVLEGTRAPRPSAGNYGHFETLKAVLPTLPSDYARAEWTRHGWFGMSLDEALAA